MYVKLKVDCDERNKTFYTRNFEVVAELPKVGDEWGIEGIVVDVFPVWLDPEESCRDYDCYEIQYKIDDDDDYCDYVAIQKEEPQLTVEEIAEDIILYACGQKMSDAYKSLDIDCQGKIAAIYHDFEVFWDKLPDLTNGEGLTKEQDAEADAYAEELAEEILEIMSE